MSKIDDAFRRAQAWVDAGGDPELIKPSVEYYKAFRLRDFGRCPRCDARMRIARDPMNCTSSMKCSCGFAETITDLALSRVSSVDDLLLDICGAP